MFTLNSDFHHHPLFLILDDDPTGGLFEDIDDGENAEAGSHVGSVDGHQTSRKKYSSVQFMTLQHTMAFSFLSLLWMKEPICLADLIRLDTSPPRPPLTQSFIRICQSFISENVVLRPLNCDIHN